jgi:hypothetical protein
MHVYIYLITSRNINLTSLSVLKNLNKQIKLSRSKIENEKNEINQQT